MHPQFQPGTLGLMVPRLFLNLILRMTAESCRDAQQDARYAESDLVGQPLKLGDDTWEVIGVVSDTRSAFPLAPTLPAIYQPVTPDGYAYPSRNGVTLVVRALPGHERSALLAGEARSISPDLTVVEIKH